MKRHQETEPVRKLLVKPKEAAEMLGISERTLASLKASGKIKAIKIGASVLYSIKELERWVERKLGYTVPDGECVTCPHCGKGGEG